MSANASKVTILLDGTLHEIEVEGKKTILDAALDAGLDAPFSCQAGACATCRAKLISGEVTMDCHDALTDAEVRDHYILTCQSRPKSAECKIEYDPA